MQNRPLYVDGFNTQPPEGGWCNLFDREQLMLEFQHTAARRRLDPIPCPPPLPHAVSTHSRPKAAGHFMRVPPNILSVSTHSRPKAAGTPPMIFGQGRNCFNTQPPEGGWGGLALDELILRGFNTQPPEGGWGGGFGRGHELSWFQHTAARRRLGYFGHNLDTTESFNTQPPEGGWLYPCFAI